MTTRNQITYRITPEVMKQICIRHEMPGGEFANLLKSNDDPTMRNVLDFHMRALRSLLFTLGGDSADVTIAITRSPEPQPDDEREMTLLQQLSEANDLAQSLALKIKSQS